MDRGAWWTQSMGLQRVGHGWVTSRNTTDPPIEWAESLPTWARECCCHTRLRLTIEHVHSALRHPHSGPTGGREQQWITGLTLPTMIWLSLWIKEAEGKAGMGRSPWSSDSKPLLYGPFSHQTSLRPYKSKQKKKLKISRQWLGSTKPRLWDPSEYRVFVVRHYGAGPTSNIGMNIFQQLLSLGCDLFDFPLSVKEDVSLGFGNVSRSPFLHIPPYGVLWGFRKDSDIFQIEIW